MSPRQDGTEPPRGLGPELSQYLGSLFHTRDPLEILTSLAVPLPAGGRLASTLRQDQRNVGLISRGGKTFSLHGARASTRRAGPAGAGTGARLPPVAAVGGSRPRDPLHALRPRTRTPGRASSAWPGTQKQLSPCAFALHRRGQRLRPCASPKGPWGQGWAFGVPWNQPHCTMGVPKRSRVPSLSPGDCG